MREDILDATDRLLFEKGDAHDISIEAVVEAVGCTPPALYYYFPSKEELLSEACRRQYAAFAEQLEASIPPTEDPIAELVARGHAYLDWAVTHPEHYRLLFMTTNRVLPEDQVPDPSQSAGLAELIDNLTRAIAAGLIAPGEPLPMAFALWSTVHGVASLAVTNPTIPPELAHAVIEMTSRAVLRALSTPAA
jgi:AcrR family transcriptional regulator